VEAYKPLPVYKLEPAYRPVPEAEAAAVEAYKPMRLGEAEPGSAPG